MNLLPTSWTPRHASAELYGESTLATAFLASRGHLDRISWKQIPRALDLPDMAAAVATITPLLGTSQRILIHGDYDADGSCGSAIVLNVLRALGLTCEVWIPDRFQDGYGLSEASVAMVRSYRPAVLITVDCGTDDHGLARQIEAMGTRVIIIDHHPAPGATPQVHALVNPNRDGWTGPGRHLCAAALAWQFSVALIQAVTSERTPAHFRDLLMDGLGTVAIATIADCVPLDAANRSLVTYGLAELNQPTQRLGALLRRSLGLTSISTEDLGWKIGPVLNASGRLDHALGNIDILTGHDPGKASTALATAMVRNRDRRQISDSLTKSATAVATGLMLAGTGTMTPSALLLGDRTWHQGVVGIVAGRLRERFQVPAGVAAPDQDGNWRASFRSMPGLNIGEILRELRGVMPDAVLRSGGHPAAAGATIAAGALDRVANAFSQAVAYQAARAGIALHTLEHRFDATVTLTQLASAEQLDDLAAFGPFGIDHPLPVFRVLGALASFESRSGRNGQIRTWRWGKGADSITTVSFAADRLSLDAPFRVGQSYDLLISPQFSGNKTGQPLRFVMQDLHRSVSAGVRMVAA